MPLAGPAIHAICPDTQIVGLDSRIGSRSLPSVGPLAYWDNDDATKGAVCEGLEHHTTNTEKPPSSGSRSTLILMMTIDMPGYLQ